MQGFSAEVRRMDSALLDPSYGFGIKVYLFNGVETIEINVDLIDVEMDVLESRKRNSQGKRVTGSRVIHIQNVPDIRNKRDYKIRIGNDPTEYVIKQIDKLDAYLYQITLGLPTNGQRIRDTLTI